MYSVRDIAEKDLHKALEQVAALGYSAVEFAGLFGNKPETVREWLGGLGLEAWGTHTGLDALEKDFNGVVKEHRALGCNVLTVPWLSPATREETDAVIEKLSDYSRRLASEGITLSYHNHAHEFAPNKDGVFFWNELVSRTALPLEMDTYWVYAAAEDPLQWMDRLSAAGRLPLIHLKDGLSGGEGKPLGMGTAPVAAVHERAKDCGAKIIVESETLCPSGIDEARICIEYLKAL